MKILQNNSRLTLAVTTILLFTIVAVSSGTAFGLSKRSLKRINKEGPVTVTAIYLNPLGKAKAGEISFEVKLDTHSVDLDQYKLAELSFISFDNGAEQKSIGLSQKGSGHHVTNVLSFAEAVPANTKNLTLIIRNIGGIAERALEWKLPVN